jgi:DNA-binding NtrC family response regulator
MSDALCVVLVVDPDLATVDVVERALEGLPVAVVRAGDRDSGVIRYRHLLPNVVLLDSTLDDHRIPMHDLFCGDSAVEIVLMTSDPTQLSVPEATARGASAILTKPLDSTALRKLISGFIVQADTRRRTLDLDDELLEAYQFEGMVGRSPAMLQIFSKVRRIAPLFQTALVTGPTGTGKELVAQAMHRLSPRSQARFAVCNCSALVETLLESQLFGHVKGSFTGASQDKAGLFEYANHGTLFLDEVGELPIAAQAKLLRILQNRELQRVGSPETHSIDVHVIAATNRNLRELVAAGKFREDLFYRLSMIEIHLSPLAERKEDVPLLQRHFLHLYSSRYGKRIRGISQRAQLMLAQYPWPGNVRELENVVGNACIMAQGEVIMESDLPDTLRQHRKKPYLSDPGLISFEELQARHLRYVLARVDGNKVRAAEILGVSRATIYDMLARRSGLPPSGANDCQA